MGLRYIFNEQLLLKMSNVSVDAVLRTASHPLSPVTHGLTSLSLRKPASELRSLLDPRRVVGGWRVIDRNRLLSVRLMKAKRRSREPYTVNSSIL